tara:strand:- start:83 stop:358 length:276 start_codon:yes stop_codon:yes gene_type:complete
LRCNRTLSGLYRVFSTFNFFLVLIQIVVIDKISKKDQFLYKWFLFLLVLVDVLVDIFKVLVDIYCRNMVLVDISSYEGNIVRSLPKTAFMV